MERQWATGFLKCQLLPKCPQKLDGSAQALTHKTWCFAFQLLYKIPARIQDRCLGTSLEMLIPSFTLEEPLWLPNPSPQETACDSGGSVSVSSSGTLWPGTQPHPFVVIIFSKMYFKYIFTISWLPNYSHAK